MIHGEEERRRSTELDGVAKAGQLPDQGSGLLSVKKVMFFLALVLVQLFLSARIVLNVATNRGRRTQRLN